MKSIFELKEKVVFHKKKKYNCLDYFLTYSQSVQKKNILVILKGKSVWMDWKSLSWRWLVSSCLLFLLSKYLLSFIHVKSNVDIWDANEKKKKKKHTKEIIYQYSLPTSKVLKTIIFLCLSSDFFVRKMLTTET